jgi:hypothetical protein
VLWNLFLFLERWVCNAERDWMFLWKEIMMTGRLPTAYGADCVVGFGKMIVAKRKTENELNI